MSQAAMRETVQQFESLEAMNEEKIVQLGKQADKHEKTVYELIKNKGSGSVDNLSRADQNKIIYLLQQVRVSREEMDKIQAHKTMISSLRSDLSMANFYQVTGSTLDSALKQASAVVLTDPQKILRKQQKQEILVDKLNTSIEIHNQFNQNRVAEAAQAADIKEMDLSAFKDELKRMEEKATEDIMKETEASFFRASVNHNNHSISSRSYYREQDFQPDEMKGMGIEEEEDQEEEDLELQSAMQAKLKKGT